MRPISNYRDRTSLVNKRFILPRDGDLDTGIKAPIYHFRRFHRNEFQLSVDAKDWGSSKWIVEASFEIAIGAILFLAIFAFIHNVVWGQSSCCLYLLEGRSKGKRTSNILSSLLELNSSCNVLNCMGDTAVHIDSGPSSRKKKFQNQKQFGLRLIWGQLEIAVNPFANMGFCSKWVVGHQLSTLDNGLEIINHRSALGLLIILT